MKRVFVFVATALLVAGALGGGQAFAAKGKAHGQGLLLKTAAGYLDVTKKVLVTDLRGGQTLAQITTSRGKSVDGLKAALIAALKAKLDAAVAAGKKSAAQGQARLARLQTLVDKFVDRSFVAKKAKGRMAKAGLLRLAAKYVGVTPKALAAELKGKSLADVATAHGKSVDGLKAALLAPFKARADKSVAAGKTSAVAAQAKLAKVAARIDKLVSRIR